MSKRYEEEKEPEQDEEIEKEDKPIAFSEFLESTPPSTLKKISGLASARSYSEGYIYDCKLLQPEIQLHCSEDTCNGIRFFRSTDDATEIPISSSKFVYMRYECSNCQKSIKIFSLFLTVKKDRLENGFVGGNCMKFGELPTYGPPTPARLIKLIGPDRETFLKGRRCENLGLGIGAFTYYRRVIENQKNRILDEIIKLCEKLNVNPTIIETLKEGKNENQFKNAVDKVKDAVPESLLIDGQNPLTLLHAAFSQGVHNLSDEECLELASSGRTVLGELSERLGQALKDEAELKRAVTKLIQAKSKKEKNQ